MSARNTILVGHVLDQLRTMSDGVVHTVVTSPPYWGLRAYGTAAQVWGGDPLHDHEWAAAGTTHKGGASGGSTLTNGGAAAREANASVRSISHGDNCRCGAWRGELGLEPAPELYVQHIVEVMREVRRVLHPSGTVWLNLGDSYSAGGSTTPASNDAANYAAKSGLNGAHRGGSHRPIKARLADSGLKPKDLVGIPWMVAFALRADGWWLRRDIIWHKRNPMPESVTDRPTTSHEYLFLLTKFPTYYYDAVAIQEDSVTDDTRRPSGSQGAWELDGRPPEQRAGGRPRGGASAFRGQGSNRSNGRQANREGRDMVAVGVGAKRNKPSVWSIATAPFGLHRCVACGAIYDTQEYRRLKREPVKKLDGARQMALEVAGAEPPVDQEVYRCKCGGEEWISHFATFPEDLVEPCVLAGTSEAGACADCGTPWERVVERVARDEVTDAMKRAGCAADGSYGGAATKDYEAGSAQDAAGAKRSILSSMGKVTVTVKWAPACPCPTSATAPCIVLDPFFGSGTAGVVARRLGRDFLGVELNPEYAAIARRRLAPVMNHRLGGL